MKDRPRLCSVADSRLRNNDAAQQSSLPRSRKGEDIALPQWARRPAPVMPSSHGSLGHDRAGCLVQCLETSVRSRSQGLQRGCPVRRTWSGRTCRACATPEDFQRLSEHGRGREARCILENPAALGHLLEKSVKLTSQVKSL